VGKEVCRLGEADGGAADEEANTAAGRGRIDVEVCNPDVAGVGTPAGTGNEEKRRRLK